MKKCSICHVEKSLKGFYARKNGRVEARCKDCHNAGVAKWQAANREKVRGYVRKACKNAYDANPEKGREKSRQRRLKCPEHVREITNRSFRKLYAIKHDQERARINENAASRRTATPAWLSNIEKAKLKEFYDVARAVTMQTNTKHSVDHIIPINGDDVCGLHVPWNLQVIPHTQNCAKKNKILEQYQ